MRFTNKEGIPESRDCEFDALDNSLNCFFHENSYLKNGDILERKKKVQEALYAKIEKSIREKRTLYCIGYYLPDLDLDYAFTIPVYFGDCQFQSVTSFQGGFKDFLDFSNCKFLGKVLFLGAHFSEVTFLGSEFYKEANFLGVTFLEDTKFFKVKFYSSANFGSSTFRGKTTFQYSEFLDSTIFSNTVFVNVIEYIDTIFAKETRFFGTFYYRNIDFSGSSFRGSTEFSWGHFSDTADFSNCIFSDTADFSNCIFSDTADFSNSEFVSFADFALGTYCSEANFGNVTFSNTARFDCSFFISTVYFSGATFEDKAYFSGQFRDFSFFRNINFEKPENIRFNIKDLSKVSFLDTNISRVRFSDITTWGGEDKFKVIEEKWFEDYIRDPSTENHSVGLVGVLSVYRNLRENYEYRRRYDDAGKFFIHEMDLKRNYRRINSPYDLDFPYKEKSWLERNLTTLIGLYYNLSSYGEDLHKPAIIGIILITFATLVFITQDDLRLIPTIPFLFPVPQEESTIKSYTINDDSYVYNSTSRPIVINESSSTHSKFIGFDKAANPYHLFKAIERSISDFIPFVPIPTDVKLGLFDYILKIIGGVVTFGLIIIALRRRYERKYYH
jgi:uncharacterized protein YjbI with pentapeptide repeats